MPQNEISPCPPAYKIDIRLDFIYFTFQYLSTGWTVRGSNPGGARFSALPDRPWGPRSPLYNGCRVFLRSKVRPERAADHSPTSSAAIMQE